jgi:CheY-like chemotaxis protein
MNANDQTLPTAAGGDPPPHIVVVDEPPDVDRACEMVRELGYRATGVSRGLEALELVRAGGVDLLLTELFMPEFDGWDLAARVEQEHPGTHVVALTSSISGQGEALLTSRHIDGYLVKPVSRRQLDVVLRALLVPGNLDRTSEAVLVDADSECLGRLEQALGDAGVATVSFTDPRRALSDALENPPDLFITELDLGPFDGLDLCADIRREPVLAGIPVFVLTDEASPGNVGRAIQLRVDGFVVKPMQPRDLVQRVLRRLGRRRG